MNGAGFSDNFLLWAGNTEHLTDEAWKRGYAALESKVQTAGRDGETAWPPTYAEFVGYCEAPACSKMYSTEQKVLTAEYDDDGNVTKMLEIDKPKPNPENVHKRKAAGEAGLANLRKMIDE